MSGNRDRWIDRASGAFALGASVFLIAMMAVTVADVALRHTLALPIFGTLDLVELLLVTTIFLALPATFLRREHIVVDVIDQVASGRAVRALKFLGLAVTLAVLVLMLWTMIPPFRDKLEWGETTLELALPRWWHWLPILFGTAASILAVVWIGWRALTGKDEP